MPKKRKTRALDYLAESQYSQKGYNYVIGLDGVGLGCVFGPIHAACVVYSVETRIEGVYDSKAVAPKKRKDLVGVIKTSAMAWGLGSASVKEYDEKGPRECELLAMERAMSSALILWPFEDEDKPLVVIDGDYDARACWRLQTPGVDLVVAVERGDQKVLAVAAASILAKVERDRIIDLLAEVYPQYGLEQHHGYATPRHIEALKTHGVTDLHRYPALKFL